MEKRIGVIAIIITDRQNITQFNELLSLYGEIIIGRMGIPLRDKGINVISLIVEGSNDAIGALCGKLGKLSGVQVKSVLTRYKENGNEQSDNQ